MPLILSSNWPRYFVPATNDVKSRHTILLSNKLLGQFPLFINNASFSISAVFPVPGSPTITTLFFFFRDKICEILLTSLSLPTIGSIFPSSVKG